ncbi:hypothetical protein JP75_23475 [Devosia riboflavina]|uniref:DUF4424 domain-containing protein n=1 Tax=Devosia riboflavina TaxID=46914 RepID=A0A087LWG3_9HYPH|nr:DUF4424 domain-containing protein [Devosia riboflavina]KFL28966.1 hypothetical protein JP75_23475 [Devosia riboflavina]
MRLCAAAILALMLAAPAVGNDTTAQLGTGGLVFVTNEQIRMASEDLYISPTEVRVTYEFENTSDEDQRILVAFPMPDIQGSGDFMVDVPIQNANYGTAEPIDDPDNLFGFATTFNGAPVDAELHQYVFNNNIDYTKLLRNLGVPLEPFGDATSDALAKLDADDVQNLTRLGLVFSYEYDAGNGAEFDIVPLWTLRSTYSWEATFEPGISNVVHTYRPSVGGTVATTFVPKEGDEYSEARYAEYVKKYCVEDNLLATLRKQGVTQDGWTNYPYYENWISYIWSTGNNWSGSIGKFTLTVDKGSTDNLVSFCGEDVKKIGPTTFQMTATDWWPPYDRELEILLLNKVEAE